MINNAFDNAITNEQGDFTMPAIDVRSRAPGWVFAEQDTQQSIGIEYKKQYHLLWNTLLAGTKPMESYNQKLAGLKVDLANPCVVFTFINLIVKSISTS